MRKKLLSLHHTLHFITILVLTHIPSLAGAASLKGLVTDTDGAPVMNAVISAVLNTSDRLPHPGDRPQTEMVQQNKQFHPFVLPVRVGTEVHFPNRDKVKHHVYSFSEAKRFEIRLYSGTSADPVAFDNPGVVALGCNIHDWMIGYIYAVDTPFFGKTDANGLATITNLPPGVYQVGVWHPRVRGKPNARDRQMSLPSQDSTADLAFTLVLKRERKRRAPPEYGEREYADVP